MDDNLNKKVQGFYKIKDQKYDQFFDSLTLEYKLLKKNTHECQMNCFAKTDYTRKQSESCARQCLDPYLFVRKSISDKLQQCDQIFQDQERKCLINLNTLENCYLASIEKLKICLDSQQTIAKQYYQQVFKS